MTLTGFAGTSATSSRTAISSLWMAMMSSSLVASRRLFDELSAPAADDVLLATDLHAGNVLRAERQPWLAIDPKPFVGDRAYDATQHLINCRQRLRADPRGTIGRFADLLQVDHERVRLWLFARAAAEPRDEWSGDSLALARVLE